MEIRNLRFVNKLTVTVTIYLYLSSVFITNGDLTLVLYPFTMPFSILVDVISGEGIALLYGLLLFIVSASLGVSITICIYQSVVNTNNDANSVYKLAGISLIVPWFLGLIIMLLFTRGH